MDEPKLFPNQPQNTQEHVQKHKEDKTENQAMNTQLNVIATKLKILEERYATIRKKSENTEENIIQVEKDNNEEVRLINDDLTEVKHSLRELTEKIELIADEIKNFAPRREVDILNKYVDYWQPLDFVTRKEVNDFLRRHFKKTSSSKE